MEDLPFWLGLLHSRGEPFLELGCGTGRIFTRLAQAGFQGFGLDRDPAKLAYLRANLAPDLSSPACVFQGDMASFHLGMKFPLIILPCNTLSTLSAADCAKMLACVHRSLGPGGWFAASIPNPALYPHLPPEAESEVEDVFEDPSTGEAIQVSSAWTRSSEALVVHWHYDRLFADGKVERMSMETFHRFAPLAEYRKQIRNADLKLVMEHGDYDGSAYNPHSAFWICVAERS